MTPILQKGSAMSIASCFVNRIRMIISSELGKDIEKNVFVLSRAWDWKKILSPNEESNLRPSDSTLRWSTSEPQTLYVSKAHYEVIYGNRLHTLG